LALCLVDVDDFSSVNELMGHGYGDQLLQALVARFRQAVGDDAMLARVSGNAFGVLGNRERIHPELIRGVAMLPLLIENRPHRIMLTSGFVEVTGQLRAGVDYLKNANIALKQAKRQNRGHHVYYTADIGDHARSRAQLLADLHDAFDQGHLFMVYQPQIDLATGAFIGLEALMRWRKEDGTLVPPDQFIPVAEQSGLVVQLGSWALQVACKAMKDLIAQNLSPLRMAVNVSLEQFKSPDFFDSVLVALRGVSLEASRLELEITESVAMLGSAHVREQLSMLRQEGIAVSIDDFGTGYSSLSYLEQLPLDRMKIDKAFVRQLGGSGSARIAEMIAELGDTMGLRVLAEGIEDRASWDALQAMGCHEGQGFYIARPMEFSALIPWIREYRT
jgi:diguanylate cyclase (GGDEF)-like protein